MMDSGLVAKCKWNKDSNYALKFNLFILWPLGLWPIHCNAVSSLIRLTNAFVSQLWMIGIQTRAILLGCGNAGDIVDYVMMAVCSMMGLAKIIAFRVHMPKIQRVFASALDDWLHIDDQESRTAMRSFAKSARKVFFFQMINCYVSNTLITVGSLPFLVPPPSNETLSLNSSLPSRELPLKTGCMFADHEDRVYALIYVYESMVLCLTAHGQVGCDILIFSLAMHVCGQLELLKARIASNTVAQLRDSPRQMNSFIEKHIHILDLASEIDLTVSEFLVVQLLLNAGVNLMLGIRILIALKSDAPLEVIRPIIAFVVMMFQLYLLSYASERMAQQTGSVIGVIYESCWYELPPKLRKDLILIGVRANRPIYLTAGHFYAMNMENFMGMLKASFSFFSILRVVFED